LKRCVESLEANALTDQGHPLFITKVLGREARYEHGEVGARAQ